MNGPFDPKRWIYEVDAVEPMPRRRVRFEGTPSRGRDVTRTGTTAQAPSHTSKDRLKKFFSNNQLLAVFCGTLVSVAYFSFLFGRFTRPFVGGDEVSPAIKAYVDRVVSRAFRDSIGRRRDFALLADGALVVHDLTKVATASGFVQLPSNSNPDLALSDDFRVGNCWSFPGHAGQLGLRLSEWIHPTHVTVDHIPLEIAADIGRAPRAMLLWGAIDGSKNEDLWRGLVGSSDTTVPTAHGRTGPMVTHGFQYALLGSFEYDIRASHHVQTFALEQYIVTANLYFGVVVLEIVSNWGGNSTCLYRVRVHGEHAEPDIHT